MSGERKLAKREDEGEGDQSWGFFFLLSFKLFEALFPLLTLRRMTVGGNTYRKHVLYQFGEMEGSKDSETNNCECGVLVVRLQQISWAGSPMGLNDTHFMSNARQSEEVQVRNRTMR
jgi:hypothetical protein